MSTPEHGAHDAPAAAAHGSGGKGIVGKGLSAINTASKKIFIDAPKAVGRGILESGNWLVDGLRGGVHAAVFTVMIPFSAAGAGIKAGAEHLGFTPHPKGMAASAGHLVKGAIDVGNKIITTPGVAVGSSIAAAGEGISDSVTKFLTWGGGTGEINHGTPGHAAPHAPDHAAPHAPDHAAGHDAHPPAHH